MFADATTPSTDRSSAVSDGDVLAVDVGATSIKSRAFSALGVALEARSKRSTPKPCEPERLVEIIASRATQLSVGRVAVGFPGEVDHGVVVDAANLARRSGPGSPVDPKLFAAWSGFDLAGALEGASQCQVVIDNDAVMAARGCLRGPGREIVLTLGTGCGFAFANDGVVVPARDLGAEELLDGATYDELLGELARRNDENRWLAQLIIAIDRLAIEFDARVVHLAGGNARRLSPDYFDDLAESIVIERDDPALMGAWRCFYD